MNPNDNSSSLPVTGNKGNVIEALNQTNNFRPKATPKASACQLCLLVLDASGSMKKSHYGGQTKADAVNEAALGLIYRLKQSSRRANFHVGIINFDHRAVVRQPPSPVMTIAPDAVLKLADLGARTDIGNALNRAYLICQAFLEKEQSGGLPYSAVILIMSDGYCDKPEETLTIAATIKQTYPLNKIRIATSLFGILNENDENSWSVNLLQTIASIGTDGMPCFLQTDSTEALRNFFIASSGVA